MTTPGHREVRALPTRRTAAKGALRFRVDTLASDPRAVSRWLSGQSDAAQDSAADLGLVAPGRWWGGDEPAPTPTSGEQVPDPRLPVALLAQIVAACRCGIDRQSWRNPSASEARWLSFLVECGHTSSDIEQVICDAVTERSLGIALDVDRTDTTDDRS
jgi:ParB family chromosome partitioning protein